MKRSDFLKAMSALPLGIFAGNEVVKTIGDIDDNDQLSVNDTINLNGIDSTFKHDSDINRTINRPELIDEIIKRTRGQIGNTHLYRHEGTPSMMLEYQGKKLLKINNRVVNKSSLFGSIKQNPLVMKTKKCRDHVSAYEWSDKHLVKSVYDSIVEEINVRKSRGGEPDVVILYDIMVTTPIYSPDGDVFRGIMYRSGYVKF